MVDLVWDGDGNGNGNGTVGWQRPATVRARASGAFAGSLPFALSALPTVQANATRFAFPSTCVDAHAHTCNCTPFVLPLFFFPRFFSRRLYGASRICAGGGSLLSDPVVVHLVDRVGTIGLQGSIDLAPTDGALLGAQAAAAFEILPWVRSPDLATLEYAVDVDTSGSTVVIVPKDDNDTLVDGEAMSVRFGALTETRPDGDVLRILRLDAGAGRWTSSETPITPGAAQEFVLTVAAAETTTVEIIVALFDRRVQGLFDGVVPFVSDPALAKTSLRVVDWPWAAADSRIELDLVLDPPFANFTRIDDAPTATTTYTLNGSTTGVGRATVRLSTAALVDGRLLAGAVSSRADVGTASIVVSLPRFEGALVYDPDMGVLFGSSSGGDDGDGSGGGGPGTPRAGKASDSSMDQTATVIAATASIGAAAVLIAAIIAGVVALQAYRQERLASTVAHEVTFDPETASDAAL